MTASARDRLLTYIRHRVQGLETAARQEGRPPPELRSWLEGLEACASADEVLVAFRREAHASADPGAAVLRGIAGDVENEALKLEVRV